MLEYTAHFATIVGLLADFLAHRSDQRSSSMEEFVEWLRTHGHDAVLTAIDESHATSLGIKAAFAEGNKRLLERIGRIEQSLAVISAPEGPLGEIALAVTAASALSNQAKDILRGYEAGKAGKGLYIEGDDESELLFVDGKGGVAIKEPRFFEDDMTQLIGLGLLKLSYNGRGEPLYVFTRAAAQIVKRLEEKNAVAQRDGIS